MFVYFFGVTTAWKRPLALGLLSFQLPALLVLSLPMTPLPAFFTLTRRRFSHFFFAALTWPLNPLRVDLALTELATGVGRSGGGVTVSVGLGLDVVVEVAVGLGLVVEAEGLGLRVDGLSLTGVVDDPSLGV